MGNSYNNLFYRIVKITYKKMFKVNMRAISFLIKILKNGFREKVL